MQPKTISEPADPQEPRMRDPRARAPRPASAARGTGNLADSAGHSPRISALYQTLLSILVRDERELTTRQLAAMLSVYVSTEPQNLTNLAARINASRPTTTRIVDKLVQARLMRRFADRADRRRVLLGRTSEGVRYIQGIIDSSAEAEEQMTGG